MEKSKIIQLTDLHLERNLFLSNNNYGKFNDLLVNKMADILVLTGDIHNGIGAVDLIKSLIEVGYKIIYVLGNGEFYGFNIDEVILSWRNLAKELSNFHFLESDSVIVNDIEFFGSCLWTSVGTNKEDEDISLDNLNNLSSVHKFNVTKDFSCNNMKLRHYDSLSNLKKLVMQSKSKKKIMLSHYLPSFESIDKTFNNSPLVNIFASNIDPYFFSKSANIKYWFHGHTHKKVKYKKDNTNIICNPYGRRDDCNMNYKLDNGIIEF